MTETALPAKTSRVGDFIANPRRAVWTLAVPVMLGMGIQTLYGIVDMIFIGRLGGDAIAALTFSMPLSFFAIGIIFGLGSGATAAIAQYLGADDKRAADNAAEHSLLIGVAMGLVLVGGCLGFRYEIFDLLGAPADILDRAVEYFQIIAAGFMITILNVTFRSILAGEGDTRTPLAILAAGTILNMGLDPLLIFWAGWGIAGAAWATVLSQVLVLVAFLYYFFVRRGTYLDLNLSDFSYSHQIVLQILRVGVPASMAMVVMSVGGMFFNRIIVSFGSLAVAAYGVGGRLDSIFFLPTIALASSMTTLAGMFRGAGRTDLVRSTLNYTIWRGQVMSVGFGIVFYVLAEPILRIFTADPEILRMAVGYIRIIVFSFPFVTIGMVSGRTFQGLGSGLPGLILTSMRVVLISVPLAYVLTHPLGLGLRSAWVAMPVSAFVSSIAALVWITARLRRLEAELATAPKGEPR
ncbi:MAG: MATE family efflux transporter [Gemmatimonadota bacterium]